jgi:outer membrane receptor protein involved in Fe transport
MMLSLVLAAAGMLGLPRAGHSQILYGLVTGTVHDAHGGALAGVTVTASNHGTGLKLETVTDATGNYTFRNMPTGDYDLAASLAGFRSLKQVGLPVTAGKNIRVDFILELGGLSETMDVRAETSLMQTEKSDLSTELTGKQVVALPLNQYRNYQSLLNLVPGATPTQFQNAEIDTPGRSLRTWVNGVQPNSNTTRVDGAVSINIWLPHHAGYIQPAETIETVNISTSAFDADQGMAAGMAQTVITKSGTNQFRGSGFWFLNRDELNANSYYNKQFELEKPPLNTDIYGGTLGGPVRKNKLFFFGGYEMFRDRRGGQYTWAVPTVKMRNGDFSEVAAAYANFRLYDPLSSATPGGRTQFPGFVIPAGRISTIATSIMSRYPLPTGQDLNSNYLLDDWVREQVVKVDRANYDLKLTFQRSASHSIWGKFSMMDAAVVDYYMLGWEDGSIGDTKVYVGGLGHTWSLGPTLVLDGNFGYNRQDQTVKGPDYGTNYGLDFGIPGVNDPNDIRASGMVGLNMGVNNGMVNPNSGYSLGGVNWMPLFRKEITYSFSSALTKVFTGHEVRLGVDVVRMELNHRQAEIGDFGLRGGFYFSGNVTGAPGYAMQPRNQFAEFLLGLPYYYSKDVQTEDMTGREWQTALYVRDRWDVNQKLTLNLGLRAEYYPLMTRAHSGLERLLYDSYEMVLGGRGGQPKDVGIELKEWYVIPRVGAAYRFTENSVLRAAYGRTINPLPWSRPLRGGFPYDVAFNNAAETFGWVTTLAQGIPPVPIPDYQSGKVKVPAGVVVNSPNPTNVNRATIRQWNVAFERRLPLGIVANVAYVGTATDGGYAYLNVNYGEPGGGQTSRKYYRSAGTTAIYDWRSCLKSRYHGLQASVSRLRQNGLMLKGAYTLSRAQDMSDDDGWTYLVWNHPMMYDSNFATAGFDRTHVLNLGFAYELPFFRDQKTVQGLLLGGWQVAGVFSAYSGTPFSVAGTNTALNCQGCGSVLINVAGDPKPTGNVGPNEVWYDKTLFSQPTGTTKEGFGNSGRNAFRRPAVKNVSLAFHKTIHVGRVEPELRVEVANIFNIVNWGAPVTTFTAPNFMQFIPASTTDATTGDGARRVRIGLRMAF